MSRSHWPYTLTTALLAATWLLSSLTAQRTAEHLRQPLKTVGLKISGWTGADNPPLPENELAVLKASSYLSRTYHDGAKALDLFVAFYSLQRAGESMHSPKNCLPGSGWEVWKHGSITVPMAGERVTINRYGVENGPNRMLVLYWYQTADRIVADEYSAKAFLIWDALSRGRTSGSIVRIVLPDEPWALNAGVEFASHLIPMIHSCLPRPGPLDNIALRSSTGPRD